MKTMYCFRVKNENEVAAPVSEIFIMSYDEYIADPASDFDYSSEEIKEPTLWGYDTYAVAEEIYNNQSLYSMRANGDAANEKARAIAAEKRRARMQFS